MIISFIGQILLLFIVYGLGILLSNKESSFPSVIARGLLLILTILLGIHFFFSINNLVFLSLFLLSCTGIYLAIKRNYIKKNSSHLFFFTSFLMLAIVASIGSSRESGWYDTYLYHTQMVEWKDLFPAIRGLGLIHERFAFNNSVFLLDAFIEVNILQNASFAIRNGFILSLTLAIFFNSVFNQLKGYMVFRQYLVYALLLFLISILIPTIEYLAFISPIIRYAVIIIVGIFLFDLLKKFEKLDFLGFFSLISFFILLPKLLPGEVASLSTDFPVYVFVFLTVFLILSKKYTDALILSIVTFTIKLSAWPIVVVCGFLYLYSLKISPKKTLYSPIFWLIVIFMVFWQIHGLLSSGTLLYPSISYSISADWAIQKEEVHRLKEIIVYWARYPGYTLEQAKLLGNEGWILRSVQNFLSNRYAIFSIIFTAIWFNKDRMSVKEIEKKALLLIPLLGSLSYFTQTPDFRLVSHWFALSFAIIFSLGHKMIPHAILVVVLTLIIVTSVEVLINYPSYQLSFKPKYILPGNVMVLQDSNIIVKPSMPIYTPIAGDDRCGFAPLPCVLNLYEKNYKQVVIDLKERVISVKNEQPN